MWTHLRVNWFCLPNPIFVICLNFQQQDPLKENYLPHLSFENCEINSIEFDSPRASQQHQECFKILIIFLVWILFNFHWEYASIINSFHIIAPNILKPSWCETPTNWELSQKTVCNMKCHGLGDLSTTNKTKQTTLLHD